ncbi:hypothetical protein MBLNU457_g0396t1 [Dothideomycetes sp. NU457]
MDQLSPEQPFRFLSLPPELRDMIYAEALLPYIDDLSSFFMHCPEESPNRGSSALTQVSTQVREESLAMVYRKATFRLTTIPKGGGLRRAKAHHFILGSFIRGVYNLPIRVITHPHLVRRLKLRMEFLLKIADAGSDHTPAINIHFTISRIKDLSQYCVSTEMISTCSRFEADERERLRTHFERYALSVVNDSQVSFEYSIEGVKRFLARMPVWIDPKEILTDHIVEL